jgi:hypothetical protein
VGCHLSMGPLARLYQAVSRAGSRVSWPALQRSHTWSRTLSSTQFRYAPHFAFVGDLSGSVLKIACGAQGGAREEPGDGRVALGGGGLDEGELFFVEACIPPVTSLTIRGVPCR